MFPSVQWGRIVQLYVYGIVGYLSWPPLDPPAWPPLPSLPSLVEPIKY